MHCSCYGLALGHWLEHTSWSICLLSWSNVHIDGLARECDGSGASTLELLHSCAGSSAWACKMICTNIAMVILMAWCGTVVAPVLMHWSCCSLALGHQHQYASCFIHMLPCNHGHIDGLTWNCGSSSADALELLQSCAGSSVWVYKLFYTFISMVILMTWRSTVVAPVLTHWSCCRLVLGHQCEYISCSIYLLPWSYWWLGVELW